MWKATVGDFEGRRAEVRFFEVMLAARERSVRVMEVKMGKSLARVRPTMPQLKEELMLARDIGCSELWKRQRENGRNVP